MEYSLAVTFQRRLLRLNARLLVQAAIVTVQQLLAPAASVAERWPVVSWVVLIELDDADPDT